MPALALQTAAMNGSYLYVPFGDGFADDFFIPLGLPHRFELFGGRCSG